MPKKAFETFRNLSIFAYGTFAFIAGTLSIILLERGMNLAEVGLYFALYSASVFLLEVPSGAFADAYGRKKAIVLGFILQAAFLAGFIFLPIGPIFVAFAFIVAAADALLSGSTEAHAVDMLYERGKTDYTHKLLSSARGWQYTILLAGSIIGGYLATFSVSYALALCLLSAIGGFFYSLLFLTEASRKKEFAKVEHAIYANIARAVAGARGNTSLRSVYFLSFCFGLATFGLFSYWQPVMAGLAGWGTDALGAFFALFSLIVIIASKFSHKLSPNIRAASLMAIGMAALLFASSIAPAALLVAAIILFWEALWGAYIPLDSTIINQNTESSFRATAISVNNMIFRLGWVVMGGVVLLFGVSEPRAYWLAGSVLLFLGAAAVFLLARDGPQARLLPK
ncbi:MAG: MFS transporter [Candidatus Micrarchaeota archaeon]